MKKTKLLTLTAITSLGILSSNLHAEQAKITGDFTVGAFSQYIWRGQELSQDSIVIQPSITMGYSGFTVNLWGNLDTDHFAGGGSNWNETDLTLDYTYNLDKLALSVGYIYYSLDGLDDSQEIYFGASYDTFLKPALKIYREFSHYPSWYITFALSHSFEINKNMSFDLGGQISYLISEDAGAYPDVDSKCWKSGICNDKYNNLHDATITAKLPYKINEYFTLTPQLSWIFPLSSDASDEMEWRSVDKDKNNFVVGGLSLSFTF